MYKLRGRSFVYIGTSIILALMFFEFALQQSIRTGVRTSFAASDAATVLRLRDYKDPISECDWKSLVSDPLGSAASTGLTGGRRKPDLKPNCEAASCTWPTFSSLGICSSCSDISEQVIDGQECDGLGENNTPQCVVRLRGKLTQTIGFGYNGNGPGTYFNASAYFIPKLVGFYGLGKDQFAGIWYPIVSMQNFEYKISHLDVDKFQFDLLSASECAIYTCVKTYNITVRNGKSHQDVISVWYNESMPEESHGSYIPPLYLDPPITTNSTQTTNSTHLQGPYSLNGGAQWNIAVFFYQKFRGLITVSSTSNLAYNDEDIRLIYAQGNVSRVLKSIALCLTDYIQTSPGSEAVSGAQSFTEIFVRVRWGYVSFPVALSVLSVVFLLLTMYATKTSGARPWKDSSLVLLYHGLEHPPELEGYPLDELRDMRSLAGKTRVRLRRDEMDASKFVVDAAER